MVSLASNKATWLTLSPTVLRGHQIPNQLLIKTLISERARKKGGGGGGHLLERQESRTMTTINADKDVKQQELSFIAGGNAKWFGQFGRPFGSFLKN